ncbi:MAG: S9 family peptidase [Bacteroidia bacterium]|nr:S9 family peptidase [Bacteroidia bacterium]
MHYLSRTTILLAFVAFLHQVLAQSGKKLLTVKDAVLKSRSEFSPERLQCASFLSGTSYFSFCQKNTLYLMNTTTLKASHFISLSALNKLLIKYSKDTLTTFPNIAWKNEKEFSFVFGDKKYVYSSGALSATEPDKPITEEHLDEYEKGKKYCFIRKHQLYVFHNQKEIQITENGSEELVYGQSVHQNEFGISKGTFWSPKGNYLAFYKMDQSRVFKYPIIDWTPYPATPRTLIYPMNGTTSHTVWVGVYSLNENKTIYLQTTPDDHYLTNLSWTPDEKFILLAELNREQNHLKLNLYDALSGKFLKTLFEEKDEKYVEPLHPALFLDDGTYRFIWQSRRDGYNHLYLYDLNGNLIRQITKGPYEVKQVYGIDKNKKFIYYTSNEGNPIGQNIYRVSLKSGKAEALTRGQGSHFPVFNDDMSAMLDVWTSIDVPRVTELYNLNTLKKITLLKSDNPLKEYELGRWRVFTIKSSDGFDLYSRIFYPPSFDSARRYPVLVYLYNGPHSQMVTDTWMGGGEVWYQYMAQKGFIVFTIDGRGTSYRGKEFEQKIFRQLGKYEMEDQLAGVNWLKSKPYVDTSRMGVYGWSYGGFMTLSLMTRHPGVFKAAVAGGPVVDWRYYEIMYGERYMDTYDTNREGFEENSLLNHIQNLKGRLLIIHGALDPVVVWQHSMLLLRKAIEKGVHFDYYVYPHHEHNVLGKDRAHLMEKITDYFIKNL